MKRYIPAIALALIAVACGTEAASTDEAPATTVAATTAATDAPATTVSPTTAATEATTTTVAESTTTTEAMAETMSEDEAAIHEAYGIAFNSESTYDMVAPYLVEPEGLEETVEGYQGIGTQMGGVSVQIDEITVNGDEAEIKYTLLFGGNPTYSDLTGSAVRTDAGWQISRDMFCGLMTSARVGCPDQ